jgi:hypothetical protein
MKDQCHRAVIFSSKVGYIKVPATGEQRKVVHRPRIYEKSYPDSESVPKPDKLIAHRGPQLEMDSRLLRTQRLGCSHVFTLQPLAITGVQ